MGNIIVAHPEKQHSYRLVNALYESGDLDEFITCVYYKKRNLTGFLEIITRGRINLKLIRHIDQIPDSKIKQFMEFRGLFLLALRRTKYKNLINKIQNRNFDLFGRKVAKEAIKRNVKAVVMYDTNSLTCFDYLKDSEIIRIMDTSIANRFYTKHIYQKLIKNEADWNHFSEKEVLLNSKEMERLLQEIQIADHFLVPSQFVKDSLLYSGVDPKKIHIVPYGVDVSLFAFSNRRKNITEGKLELLFVGQCSYRKGINYLLEAADRLTEAINLTIAGGYQSIPELYAEYESKPNIHFLGRVNHERLPEVYAKADIFILPSLSEGMSQVGLEAMASGLPLLCSKNCGVNDVVIEEQNGWILDNFDTKSIIKKLEYINKRRKMISDMGKNARETALKYSWEEYNKKVNSIISEILNGGRLR